MVALDERMVTHGISGRGQARLSGFLFDAEMLEISSGPAEIRSKVARSDHSRLAVLLETSV